MSCLGYALLFDEAVTGHAGRLGSTVRQSVSEAASA